MKKVFYAIFRIFLLITGFIPFIIFIKPKFFYVSQKAKKEFKKNKKGVLYVPNHTSVLDYYSFVFKRWYRYVHTVVAEVVYKNKFMGLLNNTMGNIKVDRTNGQNALAIKTTIDYLNKKKIVLIFPEGKLEEKPGVVQDFNQTFAWLSLKTGKPIVPFYIDGRYGLFKRLTIVVGETIYPNNVEEDEISDEEVNNLSELTRNKIKKMATICRDHKKYKTKKIFTTKYWLLDFTKITSIPIFYFVFPTKKYYLGDKKKIRAALKDNALICANHVGPCDVMFIYLHFLSRRIRIITAEDVYFSKFFNFVLKRSGNIKYHRNTMQKVDLQAFREAIDTLNGRGVVAIFPEGHINFSGKLDDTFQGGASTLSLMTNTPIIPFIFVNPYKYFCFNRVVLGEPIYPSDYFDDLTHIDTDKISAFNDIIYNKMKELYDYSLSKRSKNYDKKRYFKSFEEKQNTTK